jgi:hypothetical protein
MKPKRARYTLGYKQEVVRLVGSGQTMATAARSLLGQGLTGGQAHGRRQPFEGER